MRVIVHDGNGDVLMQLDTDQDREQVCPSLADNTRVRDLLIDAMLILAMDRRARSEQQDIVRGSNR